MERMEINRRADAWTVTAIDEPTRSEWFGRASLFGKQCPICDAEEFNYDVIDSATGFIFCGDCYRDASKTLKVDYPEANLSNWFRSIADTRDAIN